jgi:hypothetical protein
MMSNRFENKVSPPISEPAEIEPGFFAFGADNSCGSGRFLKSAPSRPFPVKRPTGGQMAKWIVLSVTMLGMLAAIVLS